MTALNSRAELVAAAASLGREPERPWPVLLLTALGAWLAAVPLIAAAGALFMSVGGRHLSMYVFGVLMLAGSVLVLRARGVALFVEQLAVPVLLAGAGCLGAGLFEDLPDRLAAAVLCLLALAIAAVVRTHGLRVLLGFAAASMAGLALLDTRWLLHGRWPLWLAVHGVFLAWIAMLAFQRNSLERTESARWAAALEGVATGWCLCVLVGLAWFAGMSFMVGGGLDGGFAIWRDLNNGGLTGWLVHGASALLAAAAAWRAARAWPTLRQPAMGGVALAAVASAACLPSLGAALLAAAWLVTTGRWRLAAAAAATCAWIVGSVYYQLQWTLMEKAAVLMGVGVLLGLLAWALRGPSTQPIAAEAPHPTGRAARGAIALSALATLAVAGIGIRQNEGLIAEGTPVFVELVPVDPRSLMQGDYMQLRFGLPAEAENTETAPWQRRPMVLAQRDARNVAKVERLLLDGESPATDQLRIELTPKNGRWVLVTDAWFFREGDAALWGKARYGEFRVKPDGRALLIGMADAELHPLLRP